MKYVYKNHEYNFTITIDITNKRLSVTDLKISEDSIRNILTTSARWVKIRFNNDESSVFCFIGIGKVSNLIYIDSWGTNQEKYCRSIRIWINPLIFTPFAGDRPLTDDKIIMIKCLFKPIEINKIEII